MLEETGKSTAAALVAFYSSLSRLDPVLHFNVDVWPIPEI